MTTKDELERLVTQDVHRYLGQGAEPPLFRYRCLPLRYTILLRRAKHHREQGHRLRGVLAKLQLGILSRTTLLQFSPEMDLGAGLFISHGGPIVVNPEAKIGRNVNIAVGAVIGQENRGRRKGSPSIGDRVWVGANAVIVGKITVGDDTMIWPNAFVNFDVPDHSIVLGNPGVIIANPRGTEGYVGNLS